MEISVRLYNAATGKGQPSMLVTTFAMDIDPELLQGSHPRTWKDRIRKHVEDMGYKVQAINKVATSSQPPVYAVTAIPTDRVLMSTTRKGERTVIRKGRQEGNTPSMAARRRALKRRGRA